MNPNTNQLLGLLRWGLGVAGGYIVGKGWFDEATWLQISGAILTIAPAIWTLFVHTDSNLVKTASVVQGVEPIKITSNAPPSLQALANDRSIPTVQPEATTASPYATSANARKF